MSSLSDLRQYDWRPVLPVGVLLALYSVFMPWTYTAFSSLAVYQQLLGLSALPTMLGSLYWFLKANDQLLEEPTPEEVVLDE